MKDLVYLDFNATTPLADEVFETIRHYFREAFGNPSSQHWAGIPACDAIEAARFQVAALLCCDATEIVFTSGGTEANNHAIKGMYFANRTRKSSPHLIISQMEHMAVHEPCRFLESLGADVTRLPVDGAGLVDPDNVRRAIRPNSVLISIMHANNEVGTIQPIEQIAVIAREHGICFHTDAAQTVGKIPVDVDTLGIDLLSVAGHKLYGPKGVGALYIREGLELEPLMHGAAHEAGRRTGTENVIKIVGFGAACVLSQKLLDDTKIIELRDDFWKKLQTRFGNWVVHNGHPERRLPNSSMSVFEVRSARICWLNSPGWPLRPVRPACGQFPNQSRPESDGSTRRNWTGGRPFQPRAIHHTSRNRRPRGCTSPDHHELTLSDNAKTERNFFNADEMDDSVARRGLHGTFHERSFRSRAYTRHAGNRQTTD